MNTPIEQAAINYVKLRRELLTIKKQRRESLILIGPCDLADDLTRDIWALAAKARGLLTRLENLINKETK